MKKIIFSLLLSMLVFMPVYAENITVDSATVVPVEIDKLFKYANIEDKDIFAYCFHQPNKFMLEKLADKMNINRQLKLNKSDNEIEKFNFMFN